MLYSRDPHLAAVGFVWLPLPVIMQLPFMLVLSPLTQAVAAGPLSTTLAGAATVAVIGAITQTLGLSKRFSMAATALFAFNPVIVFTAANGMSESWFYLFASVALLGLLRWIGTSHLLDLALLAGGLAGAMVVRYETVAFVPILAVTAAIRGRKIRRWITTAATVAIPAFYMLVLWLFAEYIIQRDPFFWLKVQSSVGHTPSNAAWLPKNITLFSAITYSAKLTVELAPGILLIGPLLLLRRKHLITAAGLLACALLFPILIVVQLMARVTWADPRYFEPCVVFVTVGALWLASQWKMQSALARRLGYGCLALLLGLGSVTATFALANERATAIEQESHFFGRLLGKSPSPAANTLAPVIPQWKQLTKELDRALERGSHRAIMDANVAFPAFVFSRHPDKILVPSDRDFQPTVSNPQGRFDYLVRTSEGPYEAAFDGILRDNSYGTWRQVGAFKVAQLYQLIPAAGPGR
jgi:hypothetical protein